MINERRIAEKRPERHDLFSSLLDANLDEGNEGQVLLTDEELTGKLASNMWDISLGLGVNFITLR